MGAELFEVDTTEEVGGVEAAEAGSFNVPDGINDDRVFNYLNSVASNKQYIQNAVTGLRSSVDRLNDKLKTVTGPDYWDEDATDNKEAELVSQAVQKKLDQLGGNFLSKLAEQKVPKDTLDREMYDYHKSELIEKLVTRPIDAFISNELPQIAEAAEDSEGDRQEYAKAMMTEEEREAFAQKERQDDAMAFAEWAAGGGKPARDSRAYQDKVRRAADQK